MLIIICMLIIENNFVIIMSNTARKKIGRIINTDKRIYFSGLKNHNNVLLINQKNVKIA